MCYSVIFAVVAGPSAGLLDRQTRPYRRCVSKPMATPHLPAERERTVPLPMLIAAIFLISIGVATTTKLEPYYVAATAGAESAPRMLMVAVALGIGVSQPFWLRYSARVEDRKSVV